MNSFVLTRVKSDEIKDICVRKVLLLFSCYVGEFRKDDETAFVQLTESFPTLDALDAALECVTLRWGAAVGGENESDVDRRKEANSRTAARQRFRVILFEITLSTVSAVCSNTAAHPCTAELRWIRHRF